MLVYDGVGPAYYWKRIYKAFLVTLTEKHSQISSSHSKSYIYRSNNMLGQSTIIAVLTLAVVVTATLDPATSFSNATYPAAPSCSRASSSLLYYPTLF